MLPPELVLPPGTKEMVAPPLPESSSPASIRPLAAPPLVCFPQERAVTQLTRPKYSLARADAVLADDRNGPALITHHLVMLLRQPPPRQKVWHARP